MGEALYRKFKATGDKKYYVAPKDGFLSIDALGFRRGAGVQCQSVKAWVRVAGH